MQKRCNSVAQATELRLFCIKPLIFFYESYVKLIDSPIPKGLGAYAVASRAVSCPLLRKASLMDSVSNRHRDGMASSSG